MDKKQMAMVLIGVATYIEILERTGDEACSYSFSYVNRELVSQPDALVRILVVMLHMARICVNMITVRFPALK